MAPLRELPIEARAVGDVDVADIDLTIAALMGGANMAVLCRWALTGEVYPEDMSQSAVTLFLNGVRTRRCPLASRRTTATTTNGQET